MYSSRTPEDHRIGLASPARSLKSVRTRLTSYHLVRCFPRTSIAERFSISHCCTKTVVHFAIHLQQTGSTQEVSTVPSFTISGSPEPDAAMINLPRSHDRIHPKHLVTCTRASAEAARASRSYDAFRITIDSKNLLYLLSLQGNCGMREKGSGPRKRRAAARRSETVVG